MGEIRNNQGEIQEKFGKFGEIREGILLRKKIRGGLDIGGGAVLSAFYVLMFVFFQNLELH